MNTLEKNSEESRDDASYQFSSANKHSIGDHVYYPLKRLRNEEPELDEPSTNGIWSPYLVESSALHGNQDAESNNEEIELDKPSTSGVASNFYNVEHSAPKKTLHGLTYLLRLLTLFVERVPFGQQFFLSTKMHETELFDNIILWYPEDGNWKYRFLQAKHHIDDKFKIGRSDLFKNISKKRSRSTENVKTAKPYLLKKYFKYYCDIERNIDFKNANLEEFLICTNVGFAKEAMIYFKCAEENDYDPILLNFEEINKKAKEGTNLVKYRLRKKKISELKKFCEVNNQNEKYFSNFIDKFRFLPNYEDSDLNENVDLASTYLKSRVLKWFETYKDNESKYWIIQDKKEFLKSLKNNNRSLLVTGYSKFYTKQLESYGIRFENSLILRKFLAKEGKIMSIITASPKLSIIKLSQLFNELKLSQDEVILANGDQLNYDKEILTTFVTNPSYKWLGIEYHNEIKLSKKMLFTISKMDNKKKIVFIGRENNVLNFKLYLDIPCFYDKNNSFTDLTMASQEKILEKQVIFQEERVILNELIDIYSGRKIVDELILENILTGTVKIGNNNAFKSDILTDDCYIRRILIQRKLKLDILQNEEVLKSCSFIISFVNRDQLVDLNINNDFIFAWEDGKIFKNGIIVSNKIQSEDIFKELCIYNTKNVYWLEYIKGEFLIRNIRNESDILHKHITCLEEDELNKNQILEKKIIILADGPGCGKSIFMTRVARQLKQIMSNIWVWRINLSSYAYKQERRKQVMKSLEDINFKHNETGRAIEFMADLLFPQEYKNDNELFARKLLIQSLYCLDENMKFPKIIFLFDGFDEISPTFKEKTITLLQALQNSSIAQMWITTRNYDQFSLEMTLHSSSFFFKPLNISEKIDFLEKLWKYIFVNFDNIKPKPESEDVLTYLTEITNNICNCDDDLISDSFLNFRKYWLPTFRCSNLQLFLSRIDFSVIAERLIYYFEDSYADKISEFTGNPLHLKIIAEIIAFRKFSSLHKLDIFSLYEEFIKYKLRVFRDDKDAAGKSVAGRASFETHLEYLITVHQEIAFETLFPHYVNKQFRKDIDKIELSRAGLLVIHDDRLEFVHRNFAEYFASQYLVEHFDLKIIQNIVFSKVLINENYLYIRKFLNRNDTFLDKLSFKSQQMIKIINVNTSVSLSQMLKEELYNLFMKFFENLPLDFSKNHILFNGNVDGKTVLHRICEYINDGQILENILKAIKDSVSFETLIKLFFKRDNEQRTALHCIDFYENNSIAKQKLQFFKLNCDSKIFYELLLQANEAGQTILHIACTAAVDITYLLEISEENKDAICKILLKTDNNGRTALSNTIITSGNPSLLQVLLKLVKSVCNSKEINYLFAIKNDSRNLLHSACYQRNTGILVIFLNAIKFNKKMVQTLLLETDKEGLSPLHFTGLHYFDFDRLKILLDFVNSNYNTETLHTLLCKRTWFETTILHVAVQYFTITDSNYSLTLLLTYLFNLVKNSKEIFYEILLTSDHEGQTVLHYSSSQLTYPLLLKELLDFVETNCSGNILVELLLKLDNNKANILHYVCCQNNENSLNFLLNKFINNTKIFNELLFQIDNEGDTAFHYTVLNFESSNMMRALLSFVKINCDEETFKMLLCKANNNNVNVLHVACSSMGSKRKYEEKLISLLKFIENDDTILNELLLKTCSSYGCTPLHYTVYFFDNSSLLQILFNFIKRHASNLLNKILLKESNTGCSLLHFACEQSNEESLKFLLYAMQDRVPILDELILKADNNGQTILHYSVHNFQMLKLLLDFVIPNCGKESFTKLIFICDKEGRTGLHTFCQTGDNVEILTYLLNYVKDNTTLEECITFLSTKDFHGMLALDYITGNSSFLLEVFSNYNTELQEMVVHSPLLNLS